jgi:hypothetical protein
MDYIHIFSLVLGITICLRAQIKFWDRNDLFKSDNIYFGLAPYTFNSGLISLAENDTYFFNFEWPGARIQGFTSYHLFCLVLDKQNGTISLILDAQSALRDYRPWIRNSKLQPGPIVI